VTKFVMSSLAVFEDAIIRYNRAWKPEK